MQTELKNAEQITEACSGEEINCGFQIYCITVFKISSSQEQNRTKQKNIVYKATGNAPFAGKKIEKKVTEIINIEVQTLALLNKSFKLTV